MTSEIKKIKLAIAGLAICFVSLAGACNANAADIGVEDKAWDNQLFQKGLIASARKCFTALRKEVGANEINAGGFSAIFEDPKKEVAIPSGFNITYLGNKVNSITCEDLFFDMGNAAEETVDYIGSFGKKTNAISSILRMGSTKIDPGVYPENDQEVIKVMSVLGYTMKQQENKTYEVSFEWALKDENGVEDVDSRQARTVKLDVTNNEIDIPTGLLGATPCTIGKACDFTGYEKIVSPSPVWFQYYDRTHRKIAICTFEDGCPDDSSRIVEYNPEMLAPWDSFVSELKSKVYALGDGTGNFANVVVQISGFNFKTYYWDFADNSSEVFSNYVFEIEDGNIIKAILAFQKNITGNPDFESDNLRYTTQNQVAYLLNAIQNNFYGGYNGSIIKCGADNSYGYGSRLPINVDMDGIRRDNCGVINDENFLRNSTDIYGFDVSKWFNANKGTGSDGLQPYDFRETVNKINELSKSFPINSNTIDNGGSNSSNTTDAGGSDPCWDSSGLYGMNWVLCPTLYNLEGAVTGISGFIDRWMQVDNAWYTSDQDNKTYKAWALMQTIANTLLIIILLAIVFSQLTGYGIDNYGIKKMLPKLVIMAILINLSFIICQLLIDASNIAGMGLNNLLQTVGDNNFTFKELISAVGGGFLALIAGAGAASPLVLTGLVAGTGGGPIAWAVFVLALLGILVGVFIFFLMIGARMIIILLFSVISPIAFACYILPNTQRFFKTWWKVFSTALMIYPICGAMYGVSSIIRGIVYHGSGTISSPIEMNFLMGLVAVLTPVLPFYIMPTLLKNTMSALGSVGGALNSLGNSLRKGLSGAEQTLRGSETYKAGERESMRNRQLGFANRTYNRLSKRDIEGGGKGFGTNLNERDQRRMARAIETKKTLGKENMDAGAALALYEFEDKSENEMLDAWEEAYTSKAEGKERRLVALTDALYSKYGVGAIANIGKRMAKHNLVDSDGNVDVCVQRSLSALGNNTVVNKAFGKDFRVKATDAFKLSTTGGKDANGHFVNLDYFSNNNGITTTHEDTLNQSSAAVERQALAGGIERTLGAGASEAILHSESNIIRNLLSDTKKRNAIEADAYFQYFKAQNPNNPYDTLQDYVDAGIADGDFIDPKTGELLSDSGILAEIAKRYNEFVVNGGTTLRIPHGQALAENQYSAPNPANNANNGGAATGGTQFKQAEKFSDAPKPGEGETS